MRRGFTLIELLVVIVIVLLVSAVAIPALSHALSHRQVSEGARLLQAAVVGAHAEAIRTGRPAGIRLLPDPAFPIHRLPDGTIDPSYPLVYNRWIPIEQPPDYSEGKVNPIKTGDIPISP